MLAHVMVHAKSGSLLLHLTLKRTMSLDTIKVIVQHWPDCVREHDDEGQLPLHIAIQNDCTHDVIQFLANSWPESCQVPTTDGDLPLHLACRYESSAVTLCLLDYYPHAVRLKDKDLQLPLHIACTREDDFVSEVIEHLVRAWPESTIIACPQPSYLHYNFYFDANDNYGDN